MNENGKPNANAAKATSPFIVAATRVGELSATGAVILWAMHTQFQNLNSKVDAAVIQIVATASKVVELEKEAAYLRGLRERQRIGYKQPEPDE